MSLLNIFFLFSLTQSEAINIGSQEFAISEFRPNVKIDMTSAIFEEKNCHRIGKESAVCQDAFSRVLGVKPRKSRLEIYGKKLSRLYFSGDHSEFSAVNRMITAKYGPACSSKNAEFVSCIAEKQFPPSNRLGACLRGIWF